MATPTSRPSASKAAASARKALRQELRACDNCRKKKIRCDGPAQINHVCTLCAKGGSDCTYVEQSISRHAPRKAYIQILESRIARTETLLHELFPHLDLNNGDLDEDQIAQARRQAPPPSSSRSQHVAAVPHSPVSTALPTPPDIVRFIRLPPASDDDLPPSDNEGDFGPLTDPPKEQLMQKSYMGKSSIIGLLSDAIDMKVGPTGPHLFKSDTSWQRPLYWTVPPYEVPGSEHDDPHVVPWDVELPPPDLLQTLIDVYFRDVNLHMPLLHRVLFEHQLATGLHKVDSQFLAVVLLVCALASRSISDPRVLAEPGQLRSAGWRYYEMAAPLNRVRIMVNGRLFDLQAKVLATIFLWGSSTPSAGWLTLGAAIGMAISVGAHRKKLYRDQPNLVDELWKRTFWMIVGLDRGLSACFGRPCGIQDESYDLDMPLEVDDVCWDLGDPSNHYPLKHEQPTDKPSVIVYFSHSIKLFQIIGFAMRTIYALNPVKTLSRHMRQHWEVRMLAELDSSLTRWSAAIPKHLHWDSRRGDGVFHRQSLALWMGWHQVRIFIHAQFIQLPTLGTISGSSEVARVDAASLNFSIQSQDSIPQSTSPQPHVDAADTAGASIAPRLGRSSMSICIESSRAMLDMVSGYLTPDGPPNGALLTMQAGGLFLASLCMLLAAWSADAMLADGFEDPPLSETIIEQLPARAPVDKEARRQYARGLMRDVQRCLDLVRYSEKFWQPGGKCWDVLNELASVEEFELCGQNEPAEGCSSPAGRRYRLLRQLFPSHYYETPDLPGAPPLTSRPSSNPWPAVAAGVAPESSTFTAIAPDADINSTGWNPFLGPLAHAHMNGPWQPLLPSSGLGYTAQISATDRLSTTNIGTEPVDPFAWLGISPYSQTAFLQPVQWRQGQQNSDWVMM